MHTIRLLSQRAVLPAMSLRALLGALGLTIALLIGLAGPIAYATLEYAERADLVSFKAKLNARRLAMYINSGDGLWQHQSAAFAEAIELPQIGDAPLRQRAFDAAGMVVFETPALTGPVLRRHAPIIVNAVEVGRVETEMSLTPFLNNLGLVTVVSFVLGLVAYLAFRVLPLRVLDRTLGELQTQNMRFDAALNNMTEGLCMFDKEQRMVLCNETYARMYGLLPEHIGPGTTFREVLEKRIAHGIHGGEIPDDHVRSLEAFARANKPFSRIQELNDGRVIAIKRRPMSGNGWVATHEDITAQRRTQERLAYLAHHDGLTDLGNRALFQERVDRALAERTKDASLAILCLDLDRFKEVNDTLGHASGDALLKSVAARLRSCVRDSDTSARLGGDEFVILQVAAEQPRDATALAARLLEALCAPYDINGHQIVVGTSIGIALSPTDGLSTDQLLRNADLALYRAKGEARGTIRFFEPSMDARVKARRGLEVELRNAIGSGEFELYYQPVVDLTRNEVTSFEALLRWNHPVRGVVSPAEFMPVAEDTGLIVQIGQWALRQACAEAMCWPAHLKVAVNLSAVQFRNPSLVPAVFNALAASGLDPSRLELEITETVLLQDCEATLATLHRLRDLGARISMDDFGTGYSSLSYLRSFPFDKIKIDQSFVRDIADNAHALAIVHAIATLGSKLGMVTTAEGVETMEQLERLRAEGCSEVQGYYFSAPRPANEVPGLLEALGKRATLAA